MKLPIIFQDEHLVAINKPSGLLVHRSSIDRHETQFAMQMLRDQIGQHVYPVHRLDKPTSGVLLFALNKQSARAISELFASNGVSKKYLAVVRGYAAESGLIDHPLKEQQDKMSDRRARQDKGPQAATTCFNRLACCELPYRVDKYPCTRYSLIVARPQTGRKHQIRRHLKHIAHPVIGDAKHGKGRHNRFFNQHFSSARLLLHCCSLQIKHPVSRKDITMTAALPEDFLQVLRQLDWLDKVPDEWL